MVVEILGNKMQSSTQRYDRRPYGVGLLIAGYDDNGPHIYQTCPSANYFDCKAMAIGARSQSARTYLEKNLDKFGGCELNELIRHGLLALRECLPNDLELNSRNVSIGVVGKGHEFTVYDDDRVTKWLDLLSETERKGRGAGSAGEGGAGGQPEAGEGMDAQPSGGTGASGEEPRPADPQVAPDDSMAVD